MIDSMIAPEIDMAAVRQEEARKSRSFKLIGEFIFQFSQIEFTVRVLLGGVLNLTDEQFNIVTAPYDFSALCTVTQAILTQRLDHKKSEIEKIFNKCRELNADRVRVAHGLWSDDGRALSARHTARGTLKTGQFFENNQELVRLTDTARQLMANVLLLTRNPEDTEVPLAT